MHFSKQGNWDQVSIITGPTHNLLGLEFGREFQAPLMVFEGEKTENSLSPETVKEFVLKGIEEANEELGAKYQVGKIRYVLDDSPNPATYRALAHALVKHISKKESGDS